MFNQTLTTIIGIDLGLNKSVRTICTPLDRIVYNLMRYGAEYLAETEAEFEAQHWERQEKNLHRKARQFGYRLEKLTPPSESKADGEVKSNGNEGELFDKLSSQTASKPNDRSAWKVCDERNSTHQKIEIRCCHAERKFPERRTSVLSEYRPEPPER